MTNARTIAILGLILILVPFLGVPSRWKMICIALVGIVLIYIGYKEYRENERRRLAKEEKTKTYTESSTQEAQALHS